MPDQADTRTDRHLSPDELLDYHGGEVSSEQREWIQDHLALCPDCVQAILDLDTFPNLPPPGPEEQLSSNEVSAEWERFSKRAEQVHTPNRRRAFNPSTLPWKLAAALLVVCLGLGIQMIRLQRQVGDLFKPGGGVELFDLLPRASRMERAEGETQSFQPLPWANRLVFILNLADIRSFPEYEVEIMAADGHKVWRGRELQRTPEGTFALEIPRRFPPAGSYQLRLFGLGSQGRIPVAEYPFDLRD